MADLWPRLNEYAEWDKARRDVLLNSLFRYMSGFRKYNDSTDLIGLACTVDLNAHREIVAHGLRLIKDPESLCVDYCIGQLFNRAPKPSPKYLCLYFDRNESFLRKIYRVWTQRVNGKRTWWAKFINEMKSVDMKRYPAIQAADMLGWVLNRHHSKPMSDVGHLRAGLLISTAVFEKVYDREALVSDPDAAWEA